MRIAYCGYDFFYSCLKKIIDMESLDVIQIFTFKTDNHYNFNEYIYELSEQNGIPVTDEKITEADIKRLFEEESCDCLVTAAYPYKIPVNASEKFRGINVHPTLLPQGRGPWPLPLVILKGLGRSGVTIHKLNGAFDAGDILIQEDFEVDEREDLETFSCKSQLLAEKLIERLFSDFDFFWKHAVPQGEGEYWQYPTDEEMSFDFSMTIDDIDRIVRAYGKFDSCVNFLGKSWLVWDINSWKEEHSFPPGTLVHRTNKEYLFAVQDGFVCLRFFQEDKGEVDRDV